MQLVPETAGWSDEGWSEGERKAGELARSIEKLKMVAPRADVTASGSWSPFSVP
jgi:hypothetical protein